MTGGAQDSGVVSGQDALDFLGDACRNWQHVGPLGPNDVTDVAGALQRFLKKRATPAPAGWQDISSAPKDGTEFLSYGGPDNVKGKVQPTRWLSPGPYATENGKNTQGERRYQWPDGFYWAGYDGFVGPVFPELWQPMPTAPAEGGV